MQVVGQFDLWVHKASSRRARVFTSGPRDLPLHTVSKGPRHRRARCHQKFKLTHYLSAAAATPMPVQW